MTQIKNSKLSDWTISIKPTNAVIVFGLFFPLYAIWLRQVGLISLTKNGRKVDFFKTLSTAFIVLITAFYVIMPFLATNKVEFSESISFGIPFLVFLIWFICCGIVGKNMIDLEKADDEYFVGLSIKGGAYILRFFNLVYYPFSIYWLQKNVRSYTENKNLC